jgi:hypothetical protein
METMSLTGKHIISALRAAGAGSGLCMTADEIAAAFNEAMVKYGGGQFNTVDKVAALVSECMMESAYFRTTEEYAKNGRYAPYIGRSFIQITWKANYASFGKWCKSQGLISDPDYFVKNPKRLADHKWAAIGGVWYFTKVPFHGHPLTFYASNILQVGRAVNMGDPSSRHTPSGQESRTAAYDVVRKLGPSITPEETKPAVEVKELIMAAGTKVHFWNKDKQTLKVGTQDVHITTGTTDVSVVTGESLGVDVVGAVEVDNPGNYPLDIYWHIVDWKDGGPTTEVESGLAIPLVGPRIQSAETNFKRNVDKSTGTGRTMRLRLAIRVSDHVPVDGAKPPLPVINNVHIDGWKL